MSSSAKAGDSQTFKLSQQAREDSKRWFGDVGAHNSLVHMTLALCGEVGELANIVKKIDRGSLDIKDANVRYQLMMETTDVYVYLLNIAGMLGLDLEQSNQHVRALNEKRFTEQRREREQRNGQSQH
jgi:NTP pyrophosphatase (non-canonical NTP hydrolase)